MTDFLPVIGIDHVELYVGNARQAAFFFEKGFGFRPLAYCGLETGQRDRTSYVLEQGDIRLLLTATLGVEQAIARHHLQHGDGVAVVALTVPDAAAAYEETTRRGAEGAMAPVTEEDESGVLTASAIRLYGDTLLKFVERRGYHGPFAPGYAAPPGGQAEASRAVGLTLVDHIVGNVELGAMDHWVRYFAQTLGFSQLVHFDDEDVSTEYSALMSKVMQDGSGKVKFPINEPAPGKRKSQVQEYLDYYGGPGVQHLALATDDIIAAVGALQANGIEFLRVPAAYYERLEARVGPIDKPIARLAELGILIDRDDEGYLLQIFTRPLADRPTLFLEIIERRGSRGFGKGNFKALFEALEREQARRGNL